MPLDESQQTEAAVLGQGAYGVVERVEFETGWYARKRILPTEYDEGLPFAALRECDIYARFLHSYMVAAYQMQIVDHEVHLVMGLADQSLMDYIIAHGDQVQSRAERVALALAVAWSVLQVFKYLHSHNVIHRDMKPDNLLLARSPSRNHPYFVYVSDLGGARWTHRHLQMTSGMGTVCYRPPEMNTGHYGKPADVYTLGCTLVHLLLGRLPTGWEKATQCSRLAVNSPTQTTQPALVRPSLATLWLAALKKLQWVPAPLTSLIRRMLQRNPKARVTVDLALRDPVFRGYPQPETSSPQPVDVPGDYLARLGLTAKARAQAVTRMTLTGFHYSFSPVTMGHATHLFDDFFAAVDPATVCRDHARLLELYALTSLWICSKYFEGQRIRLSHLVQAAHTPLSEQDFRTAEEVLVDTVGFRLHRRMPPRQMVNKKLTADTVAEILADPEYATDPHQVCRRILASGRQARQAGLVVVSSV